MAKSRSVYICNNCSHETAKWLGQCPKCNEWNTFVETVNATTTSSRGFGSKVKASKPIHLNQIKATNMKRISTGISEFDRVLGGGFVSGQVILLSGEPGIGKSTILTQLSKSMTDKKSSSVLYVAGEESPEQIKIRSSRLGLDSENLLILPENRVEIIEATVETYAEEEDIGLLIVDSIQTLASADLTGISGSVGQVRLCSQKLTTMAKRLQIPLILVGHVTKEGTIAGPKVLEHLVDTVLHMEGDSQHLYRILKTNKNRFGPVSEVGLFEMQDKGLVEVKNPSKVFLSMQKNSVPGSCVTVVMEGYRPLLFEVQALTSKTAFGYPRRTTSGFNVNRLQVLLATLEKRAGLNFSNHDVYVNIAGGFKVNEYACDLAVCLAVASSLKNTPLKPGVAAFGECGLLGEVRKVSNEEARVKEAKKLGFENVIHPGNIKYVSQALKKSLGTAKK